MDTNMKIGRLMRCYTEEGVEYKVKVSVLLIDLPFTLVAEAEYQLNGQEEVVIDLEEQNPITEFVNEMLSEVRRMKAKKREAKKKRKRKEKATKRARRRR